MNHTQKLFFLAAYPHIDIMSIEQPILDEFMSRTYIKDLTLDRQMDCLSDYILANNLTEVVE